MLSIINNPDNIIKTKNILIEIFTFWLDKSNKNINPIKIDIKAECNKVDKRL